MTHETPTFLESEIRGRSCSDSIRVEWRMISVTKVLLKFMMQTQGFWPGNSEAG